MGGVERTLSVLVHAPDPVNPEHFHYWSCSNCGEDKSEHDGWEAAYDAAKAHECPERGVLNQALRDAMLKGIIDTAGVIKIIDTEMPKRNSYRIETDHAGQEWIVEHFDNGVVTRRPLGEL